MSNRAGKIFFHAPGGSAGKAALPEAYAEQVRFLRRVWQEESYGLERVVRLFLCLSQFLFPVLLIRDIFGRWGAQARRLAVEFYTVFKFAFPLIALWRGWFSHPAVIMLTVYLFCDTLIHMLHLVFLDDIHAAAVSYRRSLLLIFLHYIETAFDFALIYRAFDLLQGPVDSIGALYFSIVATTTVGFGDIVPREGAGRLVVMAQLMVCVVFVVVFINYFSQKRTSSSG